jgi:ELWxxDGT repeat protein
MVANLNANSLTPVGNTLFFTADDGVHGTELWKTDGTNTDRVMDSNGNGFLNPYAVTNVDGVVYFGVFATGSLWKTDGTAAGSVQLLASGFTGSQVAMMPNHAPLLANAIPDQTCHHDQTFNFQVVADAFSDPDTDAVTYTATLADGSALPAWLSFNASTRTFSGTVPQAITGFDIKVTASDGLASGSDTFTLAIPNQAPVVANLIPDQAIHNDRPFSYQVPANAFSDPDSDSLTYSATLSDGSALPAWLSFNAATRTFTGTPPHTLAVSPDVKVTASDGLITASDIFKFVVSPNAPINGTPNPDSLTPQGGDTIHGLAAADTISGTGNFNVLFGDDGNDLLYVQGDQNQLFGSEGSDWLGVTGTNNALVGGPGDETWMGATGNSNTLAGSGGQDSLYANGGNNWLFGEGGTDWLGCSGSQNQLLGGDGNEWMGATGSANAMAGGEGNDTLYSNGSNVLFGENGNDWVGASGNGNYLSGGSGNDYVAATGNTNRLDNGAGNDMLVVAAGHQGDTFVFHAGYGLDEIQGFARHGAGGTDVIDLKGFGLANFAAVQALLTDSGPNAVLTINAVTVLTIDGVLKAQLQASDFLLA